MQQQSELVYLNRAYYDAMWFYQNSHSFGERFLAWRLNRLLGRMFKRCARGWDFHKNDGKATALANKIFYYDKDPHPDYRAIVNSLDLLEAINGFTHAEVIPDNQLMKD